MPARVSATDRIRTKIDALFAERRELSEILEELARLGAQLLMQAALEAEVTEFLGRERYQRAAAVADANAGSRNGFRPVTVKTTTGPVTLERPKLRGTTEVFASRLFGKRVTKTNALETLVIASFVRGLSVRDVQATIAEALGDQAAISKTTVSEVCKAIRAEDQAWAHRRLDEVTLDYLFLDASFFRMHSGSPAEPVLAAWGITCDGKPVFVGLAPGAGESTDAWADFLTDLRERGLACPLLIVSDGAKGLIAAIEQTYPHTLRQRCLIHRLRNILAKIPVGVQTEVRDGYWALFDTTDLTLEPGPRLAELVDKRIDAFAAKYNDLYPAAMRILLTDQAGLTAYLRFPVEHHARVRHSNFIERTFGETKRRTKVIGRFPGETSAISLVWAVLDRAARGWRGLTMTPTGPTAARPTPITTRPTPQTAAASTPGICRPGRSRLRHRVASTRVSGRPPVSVRNLSSTSQRITAGADDDVLVEVGMGVGPVGFDVEQQELIWARRRGDPIREMERTLGETLPRIRRYLRQSGGITPIPRQRTDAAKPLQTGTRLRDGVSKGQDVCDVWKPKFGNCANNPAKASRTCNRSRSLWLALATGWIALRCRGTW